jgi:phage tail sheath gpL-like
MHAVDGYEYSGAELQLTARKFFEVDSCSSDSSRCIFYYAKRSTCLRIDTIGERLNDMTVTRWAVECPTPKPSRPGAG